MQDCIFSHATLTGTENRKRNPSLLVFDRNRVPNDSLGAKRKNDGSSRLQSSTDAPLEKLIYIPWFDAE